MKYPSLVYVPRNKLVDSGPHRHTQGIFDWDAEKKDIDEVIQLLLNPTPKKDVLPGLTYLLLRIKAIDEYFAEEKVPNINARRQYLDTISGCWQFLKENVGNPNYLKEPLHISKVSQNDIIDAYLEDDKDLIGRLLAYVKDKHNERIAIKD